MGKIEFYGIRDDYEEFAEKELAQVEIPSNAHIEKELVESNEKNLIIFTLPIIVLIMTIVIIKQIKNGFLNNEIRKEVQKENIEKYKLNTAKENAKFGIKNFLKVYFLFIIVMLVITPIHEFLHALPAVIMGYDVKIAIGFPMGGVCWTIDDMTKIETLLFSLMPLIVLGLIPAIIVVFMKVTRKNFLVNWIVSLMSCMIIFTCGFDIIDTYNTIKLIPENVYVGQKDDIYFWYNEKVNEDSNDKKEKSKMVIEKTDNRNEINGTSLIRSFNYESYRNWIQ